MMKHDPRIEAIVKTQSTIEGLVHPAISACLADCYFVEIDVLVMFWIIKIDNDWTYLVAPYIYRC